MRTNGPREVVAASFDDLDDDGFDDALFVSQLDEQVLVYRGGATPKLEAPIIIPFERAGVPVHAVDVDGDGHKDILALHQDAAKWKAYGLDANFNVTWTKQWQEELGAATGRDVVAETDGGKVLYGSNSDECMLERVFAAGNLGAPRCRWSSPFGPVTQVFARGANAVAVFRSRDGGSFGSKIVGGLEGSHAHMARFSGMTFPWQGQGGTAWLETSFDHAHDNRVTGHASDGAKCRGVLPRRERLDLGDWHGDHRPEIVRTETCSGCTSNLAIDVSVGGR